MGCGKECPGSFRRSALRPGVKNLVEKPFGANCTTGSVCGGGGFLSALFGAFSGGSLTNITPAAGTEQFNWIGSGSGSATRGLMPPYSIAPGE